MSGTRVTARAWTLVAMMAASSSVGAREACGCPPSMEVQVIPLLPPSADGGPGGSLDTGEACARLCQGALSCTATTIQAQGASIPAIQCTTQAGCY
jgi:hypothetical protein